eukprot:359734-Chlamydomonas_euryale.AAC.8
MQHEWPEVVGRTCGLSAELLNVPDTGGFFTSLDTYLKAEQVWTRMRACGGSGCGSSLSACVPWGVEAGAKIRAAAFA